MTTENKIQSPYTIGEIEVGEPCCLPVPHLEIKDLQISYDNKTVLDNVSLDIYKGCITALIGPSGCGKTSFLSALNKLLDLKSNARVSGEIHFEGQDLIGDDIDVLKLRRRIGMIFQTPNPFPISIYRNLDLPLKEHGNKKLKKLSKMWDYGKT